LALNRIILWLGNSLLALVGLMVLSALLGLAIGEIVAAISLAAVAIACALIGCIMVFTTRHIKANESFSEALTFLVVFWLFIPVFAAIPYLSMGVSPNAISAYFESVSALTTTGASALDPDQIPKTIHIFRSLLQWSGGVFVATFAVVILAALNLQGTGVHRSVLFTFRKGELFQHLAGVVKVIATIYLIISAICFVVLLLSGTAIFEAFCLSLTSVSTGGLTPRGEPLDFYVKGIGVLALCLSCLLGAFNVAIVWDVARNLTWRDFRRFFTNVEHRALFVIIALLVIVACFYTDFHHVTTVIPEAVFFATSTGYDQHVIGVEMLPPVILISLALVGGSALSTTGGLKLIRILLLFRHLDTDLDRLTHPSRVVPVVFRARSLPDNAFLSLWMYFFGYTLVFAIGILALAATGIEFPVAVASSAASVSNMGPLLAATQPPFGFESFTSVQMGISAALMLVGRVEVLAILAFLSPKLWVS